VAQKYSLWGSAAEPGSLALRARASALRYPETARAVACAAGGTPGGATASIGATDADSRQHPTSSTGLGHPYSQLPPNCLARTTSPTAPEPPTRPSWTRPVPKASVSARSWQRRALTPATTLTPPQIGGREVFLWSPEPDADKHVVPVVQGRRAEAIEHTRQARELSRQRLVLIEPLLQVGYNQSDMARELGVSRQSVQKMMAHRVTLRSHPRSLI
jgi:hypothetical protein